MGLATIDPHIQKEHAKIHKIPGLVLIRLGLTEIQQFKNIKINKEMYGHLDAVLRQRLDAGVSKCLEVGGRLWKSRRL